MAAGFILTRGPFYLGSFDKLQSKRQHPARHTPQSPEGSAARGKSLGRKSFEAGRADHGRR